MRRSLYEGFIVAPNAVGVADHRRSAAIARLAQLARAIAQEFERERDALPPTWGHDALETQCEDLAYLIGEAQSLADDARNLEKWVRRYETGHPRITMTP